MTLHRIFKEIFNKIIKLITLLIAISIIAFMLVSYSPIDPIQAYIGADMTLVGPEQRENITAYWGLNKTPSEQYFNWIHNMLSGDLGTSLIYRSPVIEVIKERFLASFTLMLLAWLFSGLLGFLLGIFAAVKKDTVWDRIIKGYCYLLSATPTFWLGLLILIIFSVWLGWFPIGLGTPIGKIASDVTILDRIKHIFLPALTLSVIGVANIALHTREKLINILKSDHFIFAMSQGKKGFSLLRDHGLRHIMLPAITLQFASFGELFGGAVLVEQIFSYPGLGQAIINAGLNGDVPLFLAITLFSVVFVFVGNSLADLLYKVIDPRTRRGETS